MKTKPPPDAVERTIRRLLKRFQIDRIEIATRDGKVVAAVAYPLSWHPIVEERRNRAFARLQQGPLSLAEANAIIDKAASEPLARGRGDTILAALDSLAKALSDGGCRT